ncbi:MAG: prepilin-type N-terminal cleavage/methylation domain-containing protein [Candidatus Eremiobacteraeota bacterium]|nr:prepilin-type N-terminal cleavage/methylation domain-containing protein [Candidatus Eremiobacteraeota bacterium]
MVREEAQRGFTLIEATVTIALVSIALAGALWSLGGFARYATAQSGPHRRAALAFADEQLALARNAWKYGAPGAVPAGTWQTTLPVAVPSAAPTTIPVTASASYQQLAAVNPVDPTAVSAQLTITVTYPADGGHVDSGTLTAVSTLHVMAPAPGTQIEPSGTVPQPSGAP